MINQDLLSSNSAESYAMLAELNSELSDNVTLTSVTGYRNYKGLSHIDIDGGPVGYRIGHGFPPIRWAIRSNMSRRRRVVPAILINIGHRNSGSISRPVDSILLPVCSIRTMMRRESISFLSLLDASIR